MRLPNWKFKSADTTDREDDARRLHEAAWPDMFANLQSAYAELTNAQFELERRTAEIAETRDLFQQVISSMTEALFLTDRSGRVIRANPAAAALLESSETSILGRPLTAVCDSDEIPATPWKLMEIAPTGRLTNLEVDIRTMSGAILPVSFSFGLMHDKQNKITGVLAVARDMREHRNLINSLVAARTRFQELLEFAPDAIVLANHEGRIVLVNSQTEKLFGYKRDELLGQSVEILSPVGAASGSERLREREPETVVVIRQDSPLEPGDELGASQSGASEQFEFVVVDRQGREFQAEITRRQIETEDGALVMSIIRDISERRRAEATIRRSEAVQNAILDFAGYSMISTTPDGVIAAFNPAAERMLGYKAEEVIGKVRLSIFHDPEEVIARAEQFSAELGQEIEPGHEVFVARARRNLPNEYEWTFIRKDGSRFPCVLSVTALRDREGELTGFLGIGSDITERKQAETAIREATAVQKAILDQASYAIVSMTADGAVLTFNPAAERMFGFKADELIGKTHFHSQVVADPAKLQEAARRLSEELGEPIEPGFQVFAARSARNLPSEQEWDVRRRDGSVFPALISMTALRERDGEVTGYIAIVSDITERKHEQRLQHRFGRQATLRADVSVALTDDHATTGQALQECAQAIIAHTDAAASRIWLLNEADQTLELKASAGIHTSLDAQRAGVPVGEGDVGLIAAEKTPHVTNDVINDPRVSDKEWAEALGMVAFAGYPLMDGDRLVGVLTVFARHKLEDDTLEALASVADTIVHGVERRKIEGERAKSLEREKEARQTAEEVSRLKDDFLAMISHELRAPLTAILGWAQMLRSGALDRASAERALLTIERNAKSQAHLVGDLLDASRIATGKLNIETKPVELMSVVEAAVDAVRPSVEAKNLRMQIVLEPWVGPFNGDAERLKQVVWNLLSNAIKFTPAGGLIEVRLERLENKALLIVSDTGQGIDPEFLPHIFDRFTQTDSSSKRRQGGLGLGLAIVKHIVELHGGAIYAYSRGEGQGSDFMVTLPLAANDAKGEGAILWPVRPEGQEEARSTTLRGIRVLVVDDEHDTREVLSVMLARYGTEVRAAGSAAEAMAIFKQWKPSVLVSDIGMPEEDGYALIGRIRALPEEEGGEVPAIALTAFAAAQDKERALAAGFQRHIAKPVEPVALAKAVARILGRSDEGITL
jgi:PAS domain S-box-containing protein